MPQTVPAQIPQHHTSYAGNHGLWSLDIYNNDPNYAAERANMNGTIFSSSSVRLSEITDGTSNTMMFAEMVGGLMLARAEPDLSRSDLMLERSKHVLMQRLNLE